jgi:hypothetical protein
VILEILAAYDAAADMFLEPFFAPTLEVGLRGFREACQKEGHQFNKFPEDYSLWHLGTYNQKLGEITPITGRKLTNATTLMNKAVIHPNPNGEKPHG